MTFRIVPCQCPHCGSDLSGLSHDRLFFCRACRLAVTFQADGTETFPVHFIKPEATDVSERIFLPIWRFTVRLHLESADDRRLKQARAVPLEKLYVHAFKMHGLALYGNPSLVLTELQPRMEDDTEDHLFLPGGYKAAGQAEELLETLALAVIDKTVDVTGIQVAADVSERTLLGFPFADTGKYLIDGVTGRKYLSNAFDDLAEIRKFYNR